MTGEDGGVRGVATGDVPAASLRDLQDDPHPHIAFFVFAIDFSKHMDCYIKECCLLLNELFSKLPLFYFGNVLRTALPKKIIYTRSP